MSSIVQFVKTNGTLLIEKKYWLENLECPTVQLYAKRNTEVVSDVFITAKCLNCGRQESTHFELRNYQIGCERNVLADVASLEIGVPERDCLICLSRPSCEGQQLSCGCSCCYEPDCPVHSVADGYNWEAICWTNCSH